MKRSFPWRAGFGCVARTVFFTLGICAAPALLIGQTQTGVTGEGTPVENRQPSLGVRYIIATQSGLYPSDDGNPPAGTQPPNRDDPFLGEIRAVPYNVAPRGWMFCE